MKTFGEWLAKQPKGTQTRLVRETTERSVRSAKAGKPIGGKLAVALSKACNGAISVEALVAPSAVTKRKRRAS
jgi:hypothetical protein